MLGCGAGIGGFVVMLSSPTNVTGVFARRHREWRERAPTSSWAVAANNHLHRADPTIGQAAEPNKPQVDLHDRLGLPHEKILVAAVSSL